MVDIMEYSQDGSIEVIVGPMYAGKSEELLRRINRSKIAGLKVLIFKPAIDDRYSVDNIACHSGKRMECIAVVDSQQLLNYITENPDYDVLAIDEIQFLGHEIIQVCKNAADKGKRVICSGLDMDFRGEPFQIVPQIMAIAEHVTKLTAICMTCKKPATRTQRLVNGKPAKFSDPIILVGAEEGYEARCRKCHIVLK